MANSMTVLYNINSIKYSSSMVLVSNTVLYSNKCLLKSLMSLLLAGVDIMTDRRTQCLSRNEVQSV